MKKSPKKYTDEFKRDVLRLLKTSGKTKSEVERELGLSHELLRQWLKRFAVNETENKLELSDRAQLEAQIKQLKRDNAILQEERDILKTYNRVIRSNDLLVGICSDQRPLILKWEHRISKF